MNQLTRGNCKWAVRNRHAMQPIGDWCNLWPIHGKVEGSGQRVLRGFLYRCRLYGSSRDRVISGKDSTHFKIYERISEGLKWNLKLILIPFPK